MTQKFIYVNGDGDYEQSSGAYEQSDFVSSSAGAGDAGKPIVLNGSGVLDSSFINISGIDHGLLNATSLLDDDHTIYSKADGTRDYSGIVSYASHPAFTSDTEIIDKKYVDDAIASFGTAAEWLNSVIDRYDPTSGTPSSPSTGDRYLATATANGWTSNYVYEWNGSSWAETIPTTGTYVSVDDETDGLYYFGGSSWTKKNYETTTASLGCEKVGVDIRADLYASGGIKLIGNELAIEPNDFVGEGLIDDGSDNLAIDWSSTYNDSKAIKASDLSSTSNGLGASIIGVEDSANNFTSADVESVLAELGAMVEGLGETYTVGTGGVSKGDLVYISANDTVTTMPITTANRAIGVASSTESAAGSVKLLTNGMTIKGVLTGATAGAKYYWSGSAWSTTRPSTSGDYIWLGGVAENGTDLKLLIEFITKVA